MSIRSLVPPVAYRSVPDVSWGPFRLLEAVPWLMVAAAMRVFAWAGGPLALPAIVLASLALFLAFLLAARRMIEFADGRTGLADMSFGAQLRLARSILWRVLALLISGSLIAAKLGAAALAPDLLLGFDGIAFDQATAVGRLWSSALAAVVLLMVVRAGAGGPVVLGDALKELWRRSLWVVPAIVMVGVFQLGFSPVQDFVRALLRDYWLTTWHPMQVKNLVYFCFIFGFAAVRLWATLAILTFALRESYRRGE